MRKRPWLEAGIVLAAISGCAADGGSDASEKDRLRATTSAVTESLLGSDFEGGEIPFFGAEACTVSRLAAHNGSYGLRCDDTVTLTTMVPTAGYTGLTLEYARSTSRYDVGEALYVEVSHDNQAWTNLETLTGSTPMAAVHFDLGPEFEAAGVVFIRFRAEANGSYERFDLDDFFVRGEPSGTPDAGEPDAGDPDAGAPDASEPDAGDPCDEGAGPDCPQPPGTDAILEEDFEEDLGAFEVQGACSVESVAAATGSSGARCGGAANLSVRFSTLGARDLVLSYARGTEGYDTRENLWVEMRVPGGNWVSLDQVGGTTSLASVSFPLDEQFWDQEEVELLINSNASRSWEYFYLDDLKLEGVVDTHVRPRMLPSAPDFFAMPWPSDHRRQANGNPELSGYPGLQAAVGGTGAALRDVIEANIDGFGANSAVFFTLEGRLDPAQLPGPRATLRDDAPVMLVNLSDPSAERTPVLLDMKGRATEARPENTFTVLPHPGFSLDGDTTYAVILFDDLQGRAASISRAPLLDQLEAGDRAGSGLDAADFALLQSHKAQVDAYVASRTDHSPADVVAFTVFTTQTIGREFDAARATVAELSDQAILDHVTGIDVPTNGGSPRSPVCGAQSCGAGEVCDAAWFDVELEMPIFQQPTLLDVDQDCFFSGGSDCITTSGGDIVVDSGGRSPVQQWQATTARVYVPCTGAPAGGWPSITYANGTGGTFRDVHRVQDFFYHDAGLSLNQVVGGVTSYQTPDRHDAAFREALDPLAQALTGDIADDPTTGLAYAFEFNPVAANGNAIQNAIDGLYVRRVLLLLAEIGARYQSALAPLNLSVADLETDPDHTTLQGQSQGSHSAPLVLSVPPEEGGFHSAYLNASGGDLIFERAVHRGDMRPVMEQLFHLEEGEIDRFHPIGHLLQSAREVGAPINYADEVAVPGHILITNGWQDTCSLRESTLAVATAMIRGGHIDVPNTSAAFDSWGMPMPQLEGVETVLEYTLLPFSQSISGNIDGRTRLSLMLPRGHAGSGSERAAARYLRDLGAKVTPAVEAPPYDGDWIWNCGHPRID